MEILEKRGSPRERVRARLESWAMVTNERGRREEASILMKMSSDVFYLIGFQNEIMK